jgi:class 3 adenylate cyclase
VGAPLTVSRSSSAAAAFEPALDDLPTRVYVPQERMTDLLTGTVTFLFTDIESSTELLKRLGKRYGEALHDHRNILRTAVREHGGAEIDTQGDSFLFAFPRADEAVVAAIDGQRALVGPEWTAETHLRV